MAELLTDAELDAIVSGITDTILGHVRKELALVVERITTLEARPVVGVGVKYAGAHRAGESYAEGCLTSRSGGLWLAERATSAAPGNGPDTGWRLVVKEGRAG